MVAQVMAKAYALPCTTGRQARQRWCTGGLRHRYCAPSWHANLAYKTGGHADQHPQTPELRQFLSSIH
jgi:hypothetical protein